MLDENGKPMMDTSKPRYRGFDQNAVIATLVNAMKEQTQIIEEKEKKIQDLQSQLNTLQQLVQNIIQLNNLQA